jgi:hypothetical protein
MGGCAVQKKQKIPIFLEDLLSSGPARFRTFRNWSFGPRKRSKWAKGRSGRIVSAGVDGFQSDYESVYTEFMYIILTRGGNARAVFYHPTEKECPSAQQVMF